MDREKNKRLYLELMHLEFEKILAELDLVYKLSHNGEKGKEAEEIIINFLKKYRIVHCRYPLFALSMPILFSILSS